MDFKLNKKILFISGTRADYGKQKPLIKKCIDLPNFEVSIFATGMHMLSKFGNTVEEIKKDFGNIVYPFINQGSQEHMEVVFSNTLYGLSQYLDENHIDLIVVHGDRVEALAGAVVGGMKNILVAHVEGGESSGTIDESIRHSVTKFSHIHFVNNNVARDRVLRLGENSKNIFVIGSPNIDIIMNGNLPELDEVKKHYEINFDRQAILVFHPVTSEIKFLKKQTEFLLEACKASGLNFVVIKPNNDLGSESILSVYDEYQKESCFRFLPSMRFESYLALLKSSILIIGNSSSGIYDAPLFGLPTINVGSRQQGRYSGESLVNTPFDFDVILRELNEAKQKGKFSPNVYYGSGDSSDKFLEVITDDSFFKIPTQKYFID